MLSKLGVYCVPNMHTTTRLVLTVAAVVLGNLAAAETADPYLWLESADSQRAMDWVKAENAKTSAVLEKDSRYNALFQDAKRIVEAKDRIPAPNIMRGQVYNFWQDAEHVHGIWRQTTLKDFQSATPQWKTVLDLDALSKTEHANWFWKGATCAEPEQTRCLLALSDGGEDAVTVREFDLGTNAFVSNGFAFPKGKQGVAWEDKDTLLVGREWAKGELTKSGYPYVLKRIKRGQSLDQAVEVFRGKPDDVFVFGNRYEDGASHHTLLVEQGVTFFEFDRFLVTPAGVVKLPIPKNAEIVGMIEGRIVVSIHEDWKLSDGKSLQAGSLVSFDLATMTANPQDLKPVLIYLPGAREAFQAALATRGHLLVHTLDNVNGRVAVYSPQAGGGWSKQPLKLADKAAIELFDADIHSETAFVRVSSYLSPPQLLLIDAASGASSVAKSLPAKFDASKHVVEQLEATSKDGTKIPYYIVHPKDLKNDGSTPTLMSAYGGFLAAETPDYSATIGKLWLERGGSFVLANIRGGGEFGPKWHEAGLKTHRQRIFDDFAAVGQDIVTRGFTSTKRLGIFGGSNGGLLVGVEFTQHPEMWGAVDIEIPLLDMLRFEQIAAGASWVAEYGSVSVPEERAFLASISPYNNLKVGVKYPEPLIWSTSKDDRVGPQHARKFAAKLSAMGLPYLYYEIIEGGHGSGATPEEDAHRLARTYTYFSRKLMPLN
jgi:prolyl oligopeptidase